MSDIKVETEKKEVPLQKSYFQKWAGQTKCTAETPKASYILISFIGGFLGILAVAYICVEVQLFALFAPLGASAVLVYGAPVAPFSQPRNLIGGHMLSAFVGVIVFNVLGFNYYSVALAVGLAIAVMLGTRTVHPPAGATALLGVVSSNGNFLWPIVPVAAGALVILLVGLVVNNLDKSRSYPVYWF
jgi:CBS-domain-containing membrane protein